MISGGETINQTNHVCSHTGYLTSISRKHYLHNKVEVVCLSVCLFVCLFVCLLQVGGQTVGPIQLKIGMHVPYHPGKDMGLHNKVQVVRLFACEEAVCYENEVQRSGRLLPDFARAKLGSLLVL